MSFRRRALFLAGLFVAVSCSDAGNPVAPGGPGQPGPVDVPDEFLQAISCTVDEIANTFSCAPLGPQTDGALGAINIGGGSSGIPYAEFVRTNDVSTADSAIFDMAIKNNMNGQVMGTTDGSTPHPYGMRVFFYKAQEPAVGQPQVLTKINPADTAWVRVASPDSQVFAGAGSKPRRFFQYDPQIVNPTAVSVPETWKFDLENVATWSFVAYISTEVRFPKGWLNIIPDAPTIQADSSLTLTAQVRNAFGVRLTNESLSWSTSDSLIVTVDTLVLPDSQVVITGQTEGTAWIKAVSNHANAAERAARRDSVLVTVTPKADSMNALTNVTSFFPADSLPAQTVPNTTYTTAEGGTATVDGDGRLSYLSPAGYAGKDTVVYDVQIGAVTVQGRVIVQVDPSNYWYAQASADVADAGNTGRDADPFPSLANAVAAAGTGDTVFIYAPANGTEQLNGGAVLKVGQALIGAAVPGAFSTVINGIPVTIFQGGGAQPNLTRASGATVTLAQNNRLVGLAIDNDAGAAIQGTGFGTLVVSGVSVDPTGPALDLTTGVLDATFMLLSSTGSTTFGLRLLGVSGMLNAANGTLAMAAGATGRAVLVNGSSAKILLGSAVTGTRGIEITGVTADSVTLSGALTLTGEGLSVHDNSGGVISFTSAGGKTLTTGANPAVLLTGNTVGNTVRFAGGNLDITTANANGFSATGAGTVSVTGASNSVATGTGIPVTLTSVNTGTAGVTFDSVSTSTGATSGIVLNGISGNGFQSTGGTISGTTGPAVLLTNTNAADSVSLRSMTLIRNAGTGAVISGTNFGKLHVLGTSVQASGGPGALALTTGTMSGTYSVVSSNSSTASGVSLTGVNGTFNASNGSINTAGAAAFLISGGSVSGTISGTVAQASAIPLLSVSGGHETGAAVLTFAGNVTATNGNGLQFDNADGTYTFTAGVTLSGGDAGIDITNGSAGDFTFPSGANIVSPSTGNLVSILNSAPNFTYAGQFTKANNNVTGILVSNNTGGTITFNGTGTKSISSGTAAAVSLVSNTGTAINFDGGSLVITSGTGGGFNATGGGTVRVAGAGNTVTSTAGGRTVNIQNTSIAAGNVTFRSVTGTGAAAGVRVENTGTAGGFKITGDGATAGSGGILTLNGVTAADSAAFTLTNTANLGLEFVRVEVTTGGGAGGIAANNLQGTNVVRNSVFDYNQTAPDAVPQHNAYGARFVQSNTNATITLDGVTINGTRAGSSAGVLSAQGNSVVTFNVIDSNTGDGFQSLFTDLFGSGWVIGAGDNAGSTAVVNLTVRDSRFTNAAPNGTNNFEMSAFENATLNYKIKDNLFQNVANASAIAGIINVNTLHSGRFGSTTAMDSIVGNTITNSGTASTVADLGYIGIRIALENNVSGIQHRVVVANNTITDTWRQGILLSSRGQNSGYNVRVENNTVGTAGLPVGQSNRRGIEVELQSSAQMNIEVLNNSVYGAGTVDAAAALGLRNGIEVGTATLNATVTGNTLRSTSGGTTARFRAETAGTGTGVMCLDLRSNNLEDNSKAYALTHSAGTFRVEGAGAGAVSNASIQAANTVGNGNVSGAVLYNNGANCQQPAGL